MSTVRVSWALGTVMPWGLYQYKVLPMGISNAPDIFQSIMMRLLGDLEFVQVYMDDILITSSTYSDHIAKLKMVLERRISGKRTQVQVCFRPSQIPRQRDFSYSIHPQPKKVEAILKDAAAADKASTTTFLRSGVWCVNIAKYSFIS